MSKKTFSFSDFAADDSLVNDTDDLNDASQDTDDTDDQDEPIVDKTKKPDKKVDKKQPPKKVEPTEDQDDLDDDTDDTNKVVDDKTKLKDKKVITPDPDNDVVDDEEDEEDPEVAQKFFEEVEKITGQTIEVDYGDVSPLSPQGVALREKAITQAALDSFLEEMSTKFPQAFKALEHAYAGGDIAELFTQTTGRDYSKVELKEGDDATAKEILKEYYKSKGVKSEAKINKMIEADEDGENGLVKEAQMALNELKEEQQQATNKILEQQKQKASEQKKKDQILVTAVDEVLESKKLGNFRITDKQEASEFKKFVMSSIRRTSDGNYELATPLAANNLEKQLQYYYFQFKQGDLSKIIQQKAATENAKKLSLKLSAEQQKMKKNTQQDSKGALSFKDFV